MALTNAEKQKAHRRRMAEKMARQTAALEAIAGGCTMPSQTAREALNPTDPAKS